MHAQLGAFNTISGKAGHGFYHFSAATGPDHFPGLPVGVAIGLDLFGNGSKIDNSNAIYRKYLVAPGLALSTDPREERWKAALGLAFPTHGFDAFGAVESQSRALDLGLLGIQVTQTGRYRAGFAYHNLVSPGVRLPDGRGTYKIPGWMEFSLGWTSPGRMLRIHWEQFVLEPEESTEGSGGGRDPTGMNGWEAEFRPHPVLGLKFERTRLGGYSSLGFLLYPAWRPSGAYLLLEANVGHDKYDPPGSFDYLFGQGQDEGRGYSYGLTLAVGL